MDWRPIHWLKFVETLYLNRRQHRFSGIQQAREDDYQYKAPVSGHRFHSSIREPGRCRLEFCDEPVDQTSRDPKLVARRNHKFFSHFRLIGRSAKGRITASRASGRAQCSSEADCHWELTVTKSKQSLAHKSSTVVCDLSATVYCI